MNYKLNIIVATLFFVCVVPTSAHQPRIADCDNVYDIQNQDVSQAFYGELRGDVDLYRISSDRPFRLYVGILVPDNDGMIGDVSFRISKEKEDGELQSIGLFYGPVYDWSVFYEEFGGDYYLKGPEYKDESFQGHGVRGIMAEPGVYVIRVFNPNNKGKYVLTVGDKEEFPLEEILGAVKTMPRIKSDFFGESVFSVFSGKAGVYFCLLFSFLVAIAAFVTWFLIYLLKKKNINLSKIFKR